MDSVTVLMAAIDLSGYINPLKLLPVVLLLLIWARLLTWMDKDAVAAHLPREILNAGMFLLGLGGFAAFFFLPNFWIALGVLVTAQLATVATYLGLRHQKVGLGDLSTEFKNWLGGLTRGKGKAGKGKAGEVQFISKASVIEVPTAEDPARPGYDAAQRFLTEPLKKNAERIEVRPAAADQASVEYVVDGVGYSAEAISRNAAAAGIVYLKQLAGLDIEDKRKPQVGSLKVVLNTKRREAELQTAGTKEGESLRVIMDPKRKSEITLDTLGLTPEQLNALNGCIGTPGGVVLVAAPKGHGLTTMLYSIIRSHDAFTSHIQTIEHAPREDMEGVTQTKLPINASIVEELKQVQWVTSQLPDILMVDEIANPASAKELIAFAKEGRRVYLGVRAGNTFDALTMWRKMVGDDRLAMEHLRLVLAGRVLRRLCAACKIGYAPDPETLRKLNMDPERVTQLFQARSQPIRDSKGNAIPCEFCVDLHFKGRFGVFEVLNTDEDVRQIVLSGGSLNQLKTIFRKQRGRYLQETALGQVEAGETSIQEVLRVLKNPDQPSRPKAAV